MRKSFIKTLIELAEKDDRIYLLTGDLGYAALEEFAKKFPGRFINCGIAEQNMMGVAAGLALCGKKPYVYSIVSFDTFRCFEQIRNDVCYQNLDVKIIGTGAGISYGTLGSTHLVMEDLAIFRVLPNMTVISPADSLAMEDMVEKTNNISGPAYIRVPKSQYKVYETKPDIEIGKPVVLRQGADAAVIANGPHVFFVLKVAEDLAKDGKKIKVLDFHTIKPINKEFVLSELEGIEKIFTVEEHSSIGGLGSLMAEILAESGKKFKLKIIGTEDSFFEEIGEAEYLREKKSISESEIKKIILKYI